MNLLELSIAEVSACSWKSLDRMILVIPSMFLVPDVLAPGRERTDNNQILPSWSIMNIVTGSAHIRKKPQPMNSRKGINNNNAISECVNSQNGKKPAMLSESKGMELPSGEKAVYQ